MGRLETSLGRTQTTFPAAHLTSALQGRHRTRRAHFGHYSSAATLTQALRAHRQRGSGLTTHTTLPAAHLTPARGGCQRAGTVLPGQLAERTTITRRMPAHRHRIQLRQEHRGLGLSLYPHPMACIVPTRATRRPGRGAPRHSVVVSSALSAPSESRMLTSTLPRGISALGAPSPSVRFNAARRRSVHHRTRRRQSRRRPHGNSRPDWCRQSECPIHHRARRGPSGLRL